MTNSKYWLMKSEPDVFSFQDLANAKDQKTMWEGVRNYEARNFIRDQMNIGDQVLFYHSNTTPPHIAGIAEIASKAYPDPTQFDNQHEYFDSKSLFDNPKWFVVDVKFKQEFKNPVNRDWLQQDLLLKEMVLFKRNRLSITPVKEEEFERIVQFGTK